jgi:putative addiction module component (TIGR02574 family)
MANGSKSIINQALELPAIERLALAEQLLSSLEQPESEMDSLWAEEAEERIDAYERGEIGTVSIDEVFGKYDRS